LREGVLSTTFANNIIQRDGLKLATASINNRIDNGFPSIVFCGGFNSNMQGAKALAMQQLCLQKHWHYVRFDYSGHGQSEGRFEEGNIGSWLLDTLAVIDSIQNNAGIVLIGSSMGAWLATLAALQRTTERTSVIKGLG